MEELDEFEGGEEVDYDFNLDDDLLNEGEAPDMLELFRAALNCFLAPREASPFTTSNFAQRLSLRPHQPYLGPCPPQVCIFTSCLSVANCSSDSALSHCCQVMTFC